MQDIAERFSDPRPIILDGAVSTELQRMGCHERRHLERPRRRHPPRRPARAARPLPAGRGRGDHRQHLRRCAPARRRGGIRRPGPARSTFARPNLRSKRARRRREERRGSRAHCRSWAPGFRSANRQAPLAHAEGLRRQAEWLGRGGRRISWCWRCCEDIEWSSAAVDAALSSGLPVWSGFSCVVDESGTVMTQGTVGEPVPLDDALRAVAGRGGNPCRRHALGDRRHRAGAGLRPPGVRAPLGGVAQLRDHRAAGLAVHRGGDPRGVRRDSGAMGGRRSEGGRRVLRSRTRTHSGGGRSPETLTPGARQWDAGVEHPRPWCDPLVRRRRAAETAKMASAAAYANPTRVTASTNMAPAPDPGRGQGETRGRSELWDVRPRRASARRGRPATRRMRIRSGWLLRRTWFQSPRSGPPVSPCLPGAQLLGMRNINQLTIFYLTY